MPGDEPMVYCENLVKIYKTTEIEVVALQGLDLAVEAGELMVASHESHNNVFFQEPRSTDILVDLIKNFGPGKGFYGAKASDWGSGGTVAIMSLEDTDEDFEKIIEAYKIRTERQPVIVRGTSPGALESGTMTLKIN